MLRTATRNVAIAAGIALPALLMTGALVAWLGPPSWNLAAGEIEPSLTGFLGGFTFWYLILILPTLAIAAAHQVLLALLPHGWSRRSARSAILATAVAIALLIAIRIVTSATEVRTAGLLVTLIVPAVIYGSLARPLHSPREAATPAG